MVGRLGVVQVTASWCFPVYMWANARFIGVRPDELREGDKGFSHLLLLATSHVDWTDCRISNKFDRHHGSILGISFT